MSTFSSIIAGFGGQGSGGDSGGTTAPGGDEILEIIP